MGFAEDWAAANAGSTRKVGETGYTGVGMSTPDGQPNASFGYMPWVIGGGSNSAPVYNSPGQPTGAPFRSVGAPSAFDNSPKYNDRGERLSIQGQQGYTGYGNAGGGTLFQPTVVGTTAQPRLADLPMETGPNGLQYRRMLPAPGMNRGALNARHVAYMRSATDLNSSYAYRDPVFGNANTAMGAETSIQQPTMYAGGSKTFNETPTGYAENTGMLPLTGRQAVAQAWARSWYPRGGGSRMDTTVPADMRHFLGWGGGVA